ncbi:MAG: 30S ribosomal protein S2 [Cyanobacteria bacterium SZAS TMP-1]|nr:30S ribosomal protein S2 [Cyanobacteria bacterium SZAS TMP-1]
MRSASIRQLLEACVHFGHPTNQWNPKMRPFIYGERRGMYIVDLVQTQLALTRACEFLEQASALRKNIVFVATKKRAAEIIEAEAEMCGVHFVSRRWLGGTLTNFETIRMRINRLKELEEMVDTGELHRRGKKEQAVLNREMSKLGNYFGGLRQMRGKPDVLFIVDPKREAIAVKEAQRMGVTIIAIVDTNCDPTGIDYVIPGNDDSMRSIKLITSVLASAIAGSGPDSMRPDSDDGGPGLQPSGVPRCPYASDGSAELEATLSLPGDEQE